MRQHSATLVRFTSLYDSVYRCGRLCLGKLGGTEDEDAKSYTLRIAKRGKKPLEHGTPFEHGVCRFPATEKLKDALLVLEEYSLELPEVRLIGDYVYSTPRFYIERLMRQGLAVDEAIEKADEAFITDQNLRYTSIVTTNIGVTRELNRHRRASVVEKSTRLSENFMEPLLTPHGSNVDTAVQFGNTISHYEDLRRDGVPRDYAREILPLSLLTMEFFTMWRSDIPHFIDLRTGTGAHEGARLVALDIKKAVEDDTKF